MELKIKDLVEVNQNAVLDMGVQLAWYYEPERNERYATGYLFSHGKFSGGKTSAIRIFELIRDSLVDATKQNIFTIIAGYGQGKTHYALVLANYFGRRFGDRLVEKIIDQIGRCSTQQIAEHFRYFKQNAKKPQLVVKLSGHEYVDLRQNFLQALRNALDEYEATKDYAIPSTSLAAANWLRSLSDEQRARAEAFLEEQDEVELEELIGELEDFNARYETLARQISYELNGIYADFGATADLEALITQIIDELCTGEDAPFNKMVILFDELGVYLEEWLHDHVRAGNIALQSILEACRNRPGKVCFVSFIQRDPDQYANFAQPDEVGVTRFTTRLPSQTRFTLAANLELVLESLIQKPDIQQWESFTSVYIRQLESASKQTMAALPLYYEDKWTDDDFLRVVAKGAFPLHPLTAGLLCHLDFAQGRSVMGFVDDQIKLIEEQPAVTKTGNPNWILPIRIVDYFRDNFLRYEGLAPGKASYADYENAKNQLGANADEELYIVLKALFLYDIGNIKKYPSQSHASVLAQLAGMHPDTVDAALKRLEKDFLVIRYVQARDEYEFSGVGTGAGNILPQLRREVAGQRVPSLAKALNELKMLDVMDDDGILPDTSASAFKEQYVVEGNEWKLQPILMDASEIKREKMQLFIDELKNNDKVRGLLLYVLPSEVSQWSNARQDAVNTLNALELKGYPYPIAVALTRSAEGLHEHLLMSHELNNWSVSKRKLYGKGYEDAVEHIKRQLREQLAQLIKEASYIVCDKVKASFRYDEPKPDQIASYLFQHAYPYRPPAGSSVMLTSSNNGQRYTAAIGRYLIANGLSKDTFQNLEKAQQNLVTDVLIEGADKWGVLDENYRLKSIPSDSKVQKAWQTLNEAIPTAEYPIPFERLIQQFKGMPYGYDDLALTFLLTAWIGVHQHELSFMGDPEPRRKKVQPRPLTLSAVQEKLTTAKKFIQWLQDGEVAVLRTDIGRWKQAVADCIENMKMVDDYETARKLLDEAAKYKEKLPEEDEQLQALIQLEEELREDIAQVDEYLEYIQEKQKIIEQTSQLSVLLSTEREISEHPLPEGLTFDNSILTKAKEQCRYRVEEFVTNLVNEKLARLEQYEWLKKNLQEQQEVLKEYGLIDELRQIERALVHLEGDYRLLKAQEAEAIKRAQRDIAVQRYLSAAKANLMGMQRASDFEQSAPFYTGLLELKSPEDIELTSPELAQFQSVKEEAFGLLKKRYEQLLTKDTPRDERGFERQKEMLERALAIVSKESRLPKDWYSELQNAIDKLKGQFHHWRQEQDRIQREARNRRRVSDVLKRAELARKWVEIPEALSAIEQTKNELESPSNELIALLEQAEARLLQRRRRTIEAWLEQFEPALDGELDIEQAKKYQRILNNERPLGLTEEDNATVAMVQDAISATFDKHQLEKVIMEFEQLSSAELKAECLSRMITLSHEQLSENAIAQLHVALGGEIR